MKAAEKGEKIEVKIKNREGEKWHHCEAPAWNWDWTTYEYRVKPQPTLRPYKDAAEFIRYARIHGFYMTRKAKQDAYVLATFVTPEGVKNDEGGYDSFANLITKGYMWADGTPCGIEEGGL